MIVGAAVPINRSQGESSVAVLRHFRTSCRFARADDVAHPFRGAFQERDACTPSGAWT